MLDILEKEHIDFEFQYPVRSGFVLDFAILKNKLCIEVDGPFHNKRRDRFRDMVLKRSGWIVIRFTEKDLIERDKVINRIKELID
jgi:very-short-patch-repair endonuclease